MELIHAPLPKLPIDFVRVVLIAARKLDLRVDPVFEGCSVVLEIVRGIFDPKPEGKHERRFAQIGFSPFKLRVQRVARARSVHAARLVTVILPIDLVAREEQAVRFVAANDHALRNGI